MSVATLLSDQFSHHSINTGEVEIGYSVGPCNGPTILLLHGVTSRRDGFIRVIDKLVDNYRVITVDQRGHGYSGHVSGAYEREDHARDIRFVMAEVCKEPTIVWGHSMGGGNVVAMTADATKNLKGLVLEDPAVFGKIRPARTGNGPVMNIFEAHLELIDEGLSTDDMATRIQELSPSQPEYFARWKAECLLQMDSEILRNLIAGTTRGFDDPAAMLANISVPTLLLQADPDAGGILPDDYLAGIVPSNDTFSLEKIAGAGHNINREFPELMLPLVLPWLAEHS
jgi:pimeloyl-ACP methyl ester carboxylesterase